MHCSYFAVSNVTKPQDPYVWLVAVYLTHMRKGIRPDMLVDPENGPRDLIAWIWIPDLFGS